jgi:ATP-dependent DNA helicase RecG
VTAVVRGAPPPPGPDPDWDAPPEGLPGIAGRRAELYADAGLLTRRQLLYHLPVRYRLRASAQRIHALAFGSVGAVAGTVKRTSVRRRGRRSTVTILLEEDGGGQVRLLLFNRAYLGKSLKKGTRLWAAGKLEKDGEGVARLIGADYERLDGAAPGSALARGQGLPPLPIYRLPVGIQPRVHRKALAALLDMGRFPDWRESLAKELPAGTLDRPAGRPADSEGVGLDLDAALRAIHLPVGIERARAARRRLAYDEAFALSLDVGRRRRELGQGRAVALPIDDATHARLLARLPHRPTRAQARAIGELRRDLSEPVGGSEPGGGRPMARLLQGDVGSGKTLVAFYALLAAVAAGRQGALMAPTEILAAQHLASLRALLKTAFGKDAPRVAYVVGAGRGVVPAAARAERAALASGEAALAVGTHGLQSGKLEFADLALTVVDEQHRFGVRQRMRFRGKGESSHLLVMTATPIPRTLALTAYGELDVSVIDELPPGRAPRVTQIVEPAAQGAMWRMVSHAVSQGERGYVVCPSIAGDAEQTADHSVETMTKRVRRALGDSARVGSVHGKLPAAERDAVLTAFRTGEIDVLVATVLVEVGLDVPEATFVVIPAPSRFGLAQMHQIRGRVGCGRKGGRCLLLGPLKEGTARARADALCASEDGFRLAEQDLALRGPGEMLGTRQSGLQDFCALDPVADVALLADTREAAFTATRALRPAAVARLREAVFPSMELHGENLLAGG